MTPEPAEPELWKITLGELDEKMGVKIVEESVERVVATMPARPGIIAIDSFKALAAFADDARRVPPLPPRPRRAAHGLLRHNLLDRRVQRGRDRARRRSSPWPTGSSRSRPSAQRAHAPPDRSDQAARERLPLRTARLSSLHGRHHVFPRLADPLARRLRVRRPDLDRHPRRTRCSPRVTPGAPRWCRAVGHRQDLDGTALHLQRRRARPARRDREPAGEPIQLQRSPVASAGRWTTSGGGHVPVPQRRLHRRMGLRAARAHRAHPGAPGVHRQPGGSPARSRGRIPLSRISLLAAAALRQPTDQSHDDQEIPALFGISQLSEDGISHLSDNVILLQFVPRDTELGRAVTVLKTRASRHDPEIREFTITPEGIVLDEPHRNSMDLGRGTIPRTADAAPPI